MKNATVRLRLLGAVFAGLTAAATSLPPPSYLVPDPAGPRLLERDGVIIDYEGLYAVAARENGRDLIADHTHVTFRLRNERAEPVTFATGVAALEFDRVRVGVARPEEVVIPPGETRPVEVRFNYDFRNHSAAVHEGAPGWVRLGELRLSDDRRIPIETDTVLRLRWP